MNFTILSRGDHNFEDAAFRDYAKLCGDEVVTPFLSAAVEHVENIARVSLRPLHVLVETTGGTVNLPFRKVQTIESVQVISGQGVPMNMVRHNMQGDKICLPCLPVCECPAHYEVKYRTKAIECSDLINLAVWQVALDIYDGNEIRDVSMLLSGIMPGKLSQFMEAVGGVNRRLI